jgi:hypothetical protein
MSEPKPVTTTAPSPKPGIQSTELWSKLLIQLVLILNKRLGLDLEIDGETALLIVGALEGLYQGGRPYVKRAVVIAAAQQGSPTP